MAESGRRGDQGRFFYGHLLKRIGEKGSYTRNLLGFLQDCGLGYVADHGMKRRSETLKETVFPALDALKGKAIERYELDERGNIIFSLKVSQFSSQGFFFVVGSYVVERNCY